jgi:hypothetical protein
LREVQSGGEERRVEKSRKEERTVEKFREKKGRE